MERPAVGERHFGARASSRTIRLHNSVRRFWASSSRKSFFIRPGEIVILLSGHLCRVEQADEMDVPGAGHGFDFIQQTSKAGIPARG